jgi:hypothetical protein
MVMELKTLLPWPARRTRHQLIAHVEGTDTIFIRGARRAGVFTLDLKSRKVKKVGEEVDNYPILPYTSFYTPGIRHAPFFNICILFALLTSILVTVQRYIY